MLFIRKSTFHCLVCISCFLLSQLPHPALRIFSHDGFPEGSANRALTTASPLATACQHSHPSGVRPLDVT